MKHIISNTKLDYLVCTMHSWSLLSFWFYKGKTMKPSFSTIRKMKKFIILAQSKNWKFCKIDFNIDINSTDEDLDLCKSPFAIIKGWFNMFLRLQNVARTNKKYLFIFLLFYCFLGIAALTAIFLALLMCL